MEDNRSYTRKELVEEAARIAMIYCNVREFVRDEGSRATEKGSNEAFQIVKAGYERTVPKDIRLKISELEELYQKDDMAFTERVRMK